MKENGYDVISVGKIYDIFAGKSLREAIPTENNTMGMDLTMKALGSDFTGLCFTNLVDFDMVCGHRNDAAGYARALNEFDVWLGGFLDKMQNSDLLMITADHGCDPLTESTDHSREYTPLLCFGECISAIDLGTRKSFADIGKTILDIFDIENNLSGNSFLEQIRNNL